MSNRKKIEPLQFITNDACGISIVRQVEMACSGGIKWIQLRMKNRSLSEIKTSACQALRVCRLHRVRLIINDFVEIARETGADGVHLGKEDMPPLEARSILGEGFIIGGTANTVEDIERLSDSAVDYIGLGPYQFTTTKKKISRLLGTQGLREIVGKLNSKCKEQQRHNIPPLIAIGGIREDDLETIFSCGVYGVAVSSAISHSGDMLSASARFVKICNQRLSQNKPLWIN